MNTLEWAQWLLAQGFAVMPVGADKKPLLPTWKQYQTTPPTPMELAKWFGQQYPHAGIAIITGKVSNLVVVDIDPKNGGFESFNALRASGELVLDPKATPTVHTQSGGIHLYFAHPGGHFGNATNVFPGIDYRGDGGYVVAPPTKGLKGDYTWDETSFNILTDDNGVKFLNAPPPLPMLFLGAAKSPDTASTLDDDGLAKLMQPKSAGERTDAMAKLMGHYCGKKLGMAEVKQHLIWWNEKNLPPIEQKEFEYQFEQMWEKWGAPDPFAVDSLNADIEDVYLLDTKKAQHLMLNNILDGKILPLKDYMDLQITLKEDFGFPEGKFGKLVNVEAGASASKGETVHEEQEPVIVPPERIPIAMDLLKTPTMMYDGLVVMKKQGLIGEEANAQLIFLAGTSRLTEDPINSLPQGDAASGKSTLAAAALGLIPPEEKIIRWGFSPKALLHSNLDFRHKVVLILEMDGSDDADYSIRTLQSEKKISFEVVVKEDGELTTKTVTTEGPTSFVTTTTRVKIDEQNASRMWILATDESTAQTFEVIKSMTQPSKNVEDELQVFHDAQRLLARVKVETPTELLRLIAEYMEKNLKDPMIRLRRDFLRLKVAIEACALLHQYQRPVGPEGGVMPDIRDYYMIYQIVKKPFETALRPQTHTNVYAVVDALKDLIADQPYEGIQSSSIQTKLGWSKTKTNRYIAQGVEVGAIEQKPGWTYVPADVGLNLPPGLIEDVDILPDPEIILEQGPDSWKGLKIVHPITGESFTTS